MRGFFTFLIISRVGLGGILAGHYTDTKIEHDAKTSKKIERNDFDITSYLQEDVFKFAVHYTKLLRKNGQWGGERGGGILYLNKIYKMRFGVYTPKDQRSRRTTNY